MSTEVRFKRRGPLTQANSPRVLSMQPGDTPDDYYASIEWIDEEGYRVSGMFQLFGWNQCPRAIGEKAQAALSKPPLVVYHRRPRRAGSQ